MFPNQEQHLMLYNPLWIYKDTGTSIHTYLLNNQTWTCKPKSSHGETVKASQLAVLGGNFSGLRGTIMAGYQCLSFRMTSTEARKQFKQVSTSLSALCKDWFNWEASDSVHLSYRKGPGVSTKLPDMRVSFKKKEREKKRNKQTDRQMKGKHPRDFC